MRRAGLAVLLPLLAFPTAAAAHSLVRPQGALLAYLSQDATSLNTLAVSESGGRIVLRDPTVDGGMDVGSCEPGDVTEREGWIIQARCPRAGVTLVRLDLGEREDSATVTANVRAQVLGGPGADRLTGGPAADELDGGAGTDTVAGGTGDDRILSRDGLEDELGCGAGHDRVEADTVDRVAPDCEVVERVAVPPPPDAGAGDRTPPRIDVEAPRRQRITGARRTIRLFAVSSERGAVAASGYLTVGGVRLPLDTVRRPVAVAGGGAELRLVLSRVEQRRVLQALRRGRRATVRLGVVATDLSGNSRLRTAPAIRLIR